MPENSLIIVSVLLLISLFYSVFVKLALARLQARHSILSDDNEKMVRNLELSNQQCEKLREEKYNLGNALTQSQADCTSLKERLKEQQDNLQKNEDRFELIANRILESKAEKFDQQHKTGIKEILEPLKEKIKSFEDRIEKTNIESVERHSALRNQIINLSELNEKITLEAHNLTRALKSDTKKQGNWGELILESILDKSGLEKDREYHVQQSIQNSAGRRMQPDIIIDLPDKKKIIVDSKVSLVAYERFVNAENPEASELAMKAHILSIRKHIDELSAKSYHDLYSIESPDFVLMFVPIETAFSSVLKYDDRLYDYAFEMNIVIVTPSTLLATLKTVDTIWKNEKQNRYALEIASEAGRMYDKFVSFTEDMDKMGKQLDTVKSTYNESMNKMSNGTGNLIRRAEKLKRLGAKANKSISRQLAEMAD